MSWDDPKDCIRLIQADFNESVLDKINTSPVFCPPQPASVAVLFSFMTAKLYSASFHFTYEWRLECVNKKNNLDADPVQLTKFWNWNCWITQIHWCLQICYEISCPPCFLFAKVSTWNIQLAASHFYLALTVAFDGLKWQNFAGGK